MPAIPTVTVKPGYQPQAPDTSLEADVLLFQRESLDFEYLERWAIDLDLMADLVAVLSQAGL